MNSSPNVENKLFERRRRFLLFVNPHFSVNFEGRANYSNTVQYKNSPTKSFFASDF